MRVVAAAVLLAASWQAYAGHAGEYCAIPVLQPGIATTVEVEQIDRGFCGAAVINGRHVRLDQVAPRKIVEPTVCRGEFDCLKRVHYLADDGTEYLIDFVGPRYSAEG